MSLDADLFPEANKLVKDEEGTYTATIVDEDLDPIEIRFHFDDCVYIKTEDYSFICLSQYNLATLSKLLAEAETLYEMEMETYEEKTN